MVQSDANMNIRVNSEVKQQEIRKNGLPLEIRRDEPNAGTYEAMAAAEAGEDLYGPFDSVADLMEALNA